MNDEYHYDIVLPYKHKEKEKKKENKILKFIKRILRR